MDDKNAFRGAVVPELIEAKEILEKLVDLAKRRGFGREAYEIALGEKLPPPMKRLPNRPKVKGPEYRLGLALGMASNILRQPETRGARRRLAHAMASREAETQKHSPRSVEGVKKRARHFQNEMSGLKPEELALVAYFVRRRDAGDSVEMIKATVQALEAGDDEAARRVFETVRDVLARASHRKSRK
jgi:hypothetical protein